MEVPPKLFNKSLNNLNKHSLRAIQYWMPRLPIFHGFVQGPLSLWLHLKLALSTMALLVKRISSTNYSLHLCIIHTVWFIKRRSNCPQIRAKHSYFYWPSAWILQILHAQLRDEVYRNYAIWLFLIQRKLCKHTLLYYPMYEYAIYCSGWISFSLSKNILISRTTPSSLWAWFGLAPASKSVWAMPVLPCFTALERGVSPQHPLRLGSAPALEHGSIRDIFSFKSFNWRLHDPMYVLDVFKKGGKLKADILRDKMDSTVRFESSFLRVPLMYQPLLPCAN